MNVPTKISTSEPPRRVRPRAFDTTGYGILAQLLDLYRDDFRSDANTYRVPSSGEVVTRGAAFDRLAVRMGEVLRTDKLAEIEQSLSNNLRAVLGPTAAGAEVTIALPTTEELLAEVLSLRVQDDSASPILSVDRLGDGYRSLLGVCLAAEQKCRVSVIGSSALLAVVEVLRDLNRRGARRVPDDAPVGFVPRSWRRT